MAPRRPRRTRVEGALAQVQGALGVIPSASGAFLYQACDGVQIDPATLAGETAANGVPIPALLTALRQAIGVPEHTQYLHWGATSQDIMDTALALRLRRVLDLWEQRLTALLAALAALAESHADLPMAARTFGQIATPTTFGAMAASWGWPLLAHQGGLQAARRAVLRVSLSGAAGTLSAMGPLGPRVRAELATELGLADPGHGWHADRSGIAQLAGWMAGLAGTLGKLGEDLILLSQSGIAEVRIAGDSASGPSVSRAPAAITRSEPAICQPAGRSPKIGMERR